MNESIIASGSTVPKKEPTDREKNKERAAERNAIVSRLLENEDFHWFLEKMVKAEMDRLECPIHALETADLDRRRSVIEWNAMLAVKEWASREQDACRATLNS